MGRSSLLIEFVGCSGAGKSSVIKELLRRSEVEGYEFVGSRSLVAGLTGTRWIHSSMLQNVAWDILLLPTAFRTMAYTGPPRRFVLRNSMVHGMTLLERTIRLRAAIRQVGSHGLLAAKAPPGARILVDEGLMATLQSLMVHIVRPCQREEIVTFSELLSPPDLVVHINPPVEVCLRRSFERTDKPLRGRLVRHLNSFVRNAHEAYCILGDAPSLAGRWVRVDPRGAALHSVERAADAVLTAMTPYLHKTDVEEAKSDE